MNRGLKALGALSTGLMFIVLQMGALVTNTGSADGCGASWPLCKGTFMPDWDYEAIIEFSHRAVSGLGGLSVLILAVWAWRALPQRPLVRWLAVGALGFTVFQGLLGAAAVVWPQPKAVLALHFGISLICFSLVLLTTSLLMSPPVGSAVSPLVTRWVWTVILFAYGVIYLGAYVRHMRASAACLGWPLCNGQLIPSLYGPVGANFAHRVGAALLVLLVVRLFFLVRRMAGDRTELRRAGGLALLFILLQVAEGALMPLGYLNLLTQMAHTALITLFWGALSYLGLGVLLGAASRVVPGLGDRSPGLAP
ncbi:MAG TPA: COX15/CtaA family protein [Symbiobacteriaceae bacterium]|nr:COX15/CtaA family protein [Symbiobacteriaceae bacterium]